MISGHQLISLSIISLVYTIPCFSLKCYECQSYDSGCASDEPKKAKICEGHYCVKVAFKSVSATLLRRRCSDVGVEDKCTTHSASGMDTISCICRREFCNHASHYRFTIMKNLGNFVLSLIVTVFTSYQCTGLFHNPC